MEGDRFNKSGRGNSREKLVSTQGRVCVYRVSELNEGTQGNEQGPLGWLSKSVI